MVDPRYVDDCDCGADHLGLHHARDCRMVVTLRYELEAYITLTVAEAGVAEPIHYGIVYREDGLPDIFTSWTDGEVIQGA